MKKDVIQYLEDRYNMDSYCRIIVESFDPMYIDSEKIINTIMSNKYPEEALFDYLDGCYFDNNSYEKSSILEDVASHFSLMKEEIEEIDECISVESDAYNRIYNTDVDVTVVLNYGDLNYDYTVNNLLNYYGEAYGNKSMDPNSCMLLLARRMKCEKELKTSIREWFNGSYKRSNHSKLIRSFIDEFNNNTSSTSAAAILCHMTIGDIIKYRCYYNDISKNSFSVYNPRKYRKGNNKVLTVAPNATVGLYDYFHGSGSLLGINNEDELIIPLKYIHHIESVDIIDRTYGLNTYVTNKSKAVVLC